MEEQVSAINIRTPKKVLHFSDGILEIFDDDEEKKLQAEAQEPEVDEVSLLIERTISYKSCLIVVSKWVLDESQADLSWKCFLQFKFGRWAATKKF